MRRIRKEKEDDYKDEISGKEVWLEEVSDL